MDYSVFRQKKAEKKPAPAAAPAATPAAAAAHAAAPGAVATPQREENGYSRRRGSEQHMGGWGTRGGGGGGGGGYMDPFMDGWGGGGYFNQMDNFSSARRLNNVDLTYTRRALINFRDYNESDAAYYDSRPPTRRHQVFSNDYDDDCCYGHGHAALPPYRSASYRLPPGPPPPSSSRYYGGHEPHYAPPPPARYPSYFY